MGSTTGLVKETLLDPAVLQPLNQLEEENMKGCTPKGYHQHSTVGIVALL